MSVASGSSRSEIFHNTEPFVDAQNDSTAEEEPAPEEVIDPFANNGERRSHGQIETASEDEESPGAGGEERSNPIDAVEGDRSEGQRNSASSPAVDSTLAHDGGPLDRGQSTDTTEPTREESETNLESVNSNINGDRGESGTDLFVNADPFHATGRGPGSVSANESSTDNQANSRDTVSTSGSSNDAADEKPRVAFAGEEKIDKAPTHADSSADVVDLIKTTSEKIKEKFRIHDVRSTGISKRFNPTAVRMRVAWNEATGGGNNEKGTDQELGILWRSRDNRKGRSSIVIPKSYPNPYPFNADQYYTSSFKEVKKNLWRMLTTFPYWDMAFWSGFAYTWGSVLFVMDGAWAWIPTAYPLKLTGIETYGVGIVFFIGALMYQVGAVMAYLEAVNDGSFHGSAMRRFLEGHDADQKELLDAKIHHFFGHFIPHFSKDDPAAEADDRHDSVDPNIGWRTRERRERPGSLYPAGKLPAPRRGGVDLGETEEGESKEYYTWRWWPRWETLKHHHIYEIGYIACSIQLFGATLFSMCGLVSLHGIFDTLNYSGVLGAYWAPEIIGSVCFLTASFMFILETQEKWWKPQWHVMGWWIGFWAAVGSVGFLLDGVFGAVSAVTGQNWAEYQADLSSTWGSFGYLLSSLCQWYEAVNKHPVEEMFNEPGDMKTMDVHLP